MIPTIEMEVHFMDFSVIALAALSSVWICRRLNVPEIERHRTIGIEVASHFSRLRANAPPYTPLFLLCALLLFSVPSPANAAAEGSSAIKFTATSGAWTVQKQKGKIVAQNSVSKVKKTVLTDINTNDEDEQEISRFEIVSLVGPVLTAAESHYQYGQGAAHPNHLCHLVTVNLDTGKTPVRLTELFPEAQIVAELLKDKIVKKALDGERPKTMEELSRLESGRASFREINESFAFHHIKGDKVAIRIGLSHAAEVDRGSYTELGIYLPIPPTLAAYLAEANQKKLLQGHTKVKPRDVF